MHILIPVLVIAVLGSMIATYKAGEHADAAKGEAERLKHALTISQKAHESLTETNEHLQADHDARVANLHQEIERLTNENREMEARPCPEHCSIQWPSSDSE